VVLSVWPVTQRWSPVSPGALPSPSSCSRSPSIYAIEQEVHLHRLARMLIDERVLSRLSPTGCMSSRPRRRKAINSVWT
jgi:hypothetical protein